MSDAAFKYVYGPVPSRRLGRSLGVDLVPFKVCTYDCIYCQLGRTTEKTIERREYVPVDAVLAEIGRKLAEGPAPDYISLAGSGEPTLNSGIGELIRRVKATTAVPVTVLTNGALLWMREVQDDLMEADLVLPSLDAGDEKLFQHVNRPHGGISFDRMVEGIAEFTRRFPGEVWLEVFLLGGVTGIPAEVEKIAALVRRIAPARTQLNTVTRPPAEDFAFAVPREEMERLAKLIPGEVEIIAEGGPDEGLAASARRTTGEEVLAMLGRRPCTIEDISRGLGLNRIEVLKLIDALAKAEAVVSERVGQKVYYSRSGRSKG
ncbi:MAG: radical SAM protein [Proteobacteria bacterium]|nr:radical SAM protein [Pseudomonadota bacterium]